MSWPPKLMQGSVLEIEGQAATSQLVAMTLGNLADLPFFDPELCLGEVTFSPVAMVEGKVRRVLGTSLRNLILVSKVEVSQDEQQLTVTVEYVEQETGQQAQVVV